METIDSQASKLRLRIVLTQVLFILNAVIWVLFLLLFMSDQVMPGSAASDWIIPILMAVNVLAMFACGIGLGRRSRLFYYLSLAVIGVNILLSVAGRLGLFNYATLTLDLVILALLIASRNGFTASSKPGDLPSPTP